MVIQSRTVRWKVHVARMGEMQNIYKILVGKPEPHERSSCRWDDNIRVDLTEIVWEIVDWMHLA